MDLKVKIFDSVPDIDYCPEELQDGFNQKLLNAIRAEMTPNMVVAIDSLKGEQQLDCAVRLLLYNFANIYGPKEFREFLIKLVHECSHSASIFSK